MPLTLLRPMDAVVALYAEGAHEMSEALIARISYRVSGNSNPLTTTSK